jgi:MraZ protein
MTESERLLLGEFRRTLDERYRISLPAPLATCFGEGECILAKERPGALSLWRSADWQHRLADGVDLLAQKLRAGRLQQRLAEVQSLGRLLSTRHTEVALAGRGRILLPEGFREFLGVEPGGDVMIIGAAVCLEFWRPQAWLSYLDENIARFQPLFDRLSE